MANKHKKCNNKECKFNQPKIALINNCILYKNVEECSNYYESKKEEIFNMWKTIFKYAMGI